MSDMKLRKKTDIGILRPTKFTAVLNSSCEESWKYIVISKGNISGKFKIERSNDVKKDVVLVLPEALDKILDESQVDCCECSESEFYKYKIWRDKAQFTAFLGLLLVIIATIIDGSFFISKAGFVLIEFASSVIFALIVISMAFKIGGLILVYYKGLLTDK